MEKDDGEYGGKGKTRREDGVADTEITPKGWSAVKPRTTFVPLPKDPGPKPPPWEEPEPPKSPPPKTP